MLNEARVPAAEFGKGLPLHPARLQAVRAALKIVPLLPDDVAADEVAVVHRHALKLSGPPGAYLFGQIMNVEPKHCRRSNVTTTSTLVIPSVAATSVVTATCPA